MSQAASAAKHQVSKTTVDQTPAYLKEVTRASKFLAAAIADLVPNGRRKSLALTKLEESLMWAEKAMREGE